MVMTLRSLPYLLLASCGGTFAPETLVDALRVLAVTADPPEVGPGETATMRVSYFDPSRVGGKTTVLWVGCEPDPQDLGRSACNEASILLDPTIITDYPPGLSLLGFGLSTSYRSTPGVFDVLSADNPIRQSGSVGQVMALVVGEEVDPSATGEQLRGYFDRIAKKQTQAVVALTRVLVSQKPVSMRNKNPSIGQLFIDGLKHPPGAQVALLPAQQIALLVAVEDAVRERYTLVLPSGPVERQETVVGAWYSNAGRFSRERFDVTSPEVTQFTAPGATADDPVPARRTGTIWLVIRDNRGGQAFATYPSYVCDQTAAMPTVRRVALESQTVVLEGENIDQLLDVIVDGRALQNGSYDSSRRAFTGRLPSDTVGTHQLGLRGRNCQTTDGPVLSVE
jgi:hypothetical protein